MAEPRELIITDDGEALFSGHVGMRVQLPAQQLRCSPDLAAAIRELDAAAEPGRPSPSLLIFGASEIIADESVLSGDWHLEQAGRVIQTGHLDAASLDSAAS
jgi:hypothetical protein